MQIERGRRQQTISSRSDQLPCGWLSFFFLFCLAGTAQPNPNPVTLILNVAPIALHARSKRLDRGCK